MKKMENCKKGQISNIKLLECLIIILLWVIIIIIVNYSSNYFVMFYFIRYLLIPKIALHEKAS